jgi:hypothetical protein
MGSIIGAQDIWVVDGVDLRTHAWNIEAVTAGQGLPPRRGDNLRIPFRHGARSYKKYYDQRALTLAMFVVGCDPDDGSVPKGDQALLARLYTHLDGLREVFGRTDRLLELVHILPNGEQRTAHAEVVGSMDFATVAGGMARFAVDLNMPDPFWYGSTAVESVVFDEDPTAWTIIHPGTFETANLVLEIVGACENPRLTHDSGTYLEVSTTLLEGDVLVVDCENFTATLNGDSVIGSLRHAGDPAFMKLLPGSNSLSLHSDSAPVAVATITYQPRYL